MRTGSRLLLLTSLLAVAACGDDARQATDPVGRGLTPDLQDGRNGGNSRFYFLPPIAPDPSAYITPGAFSAIWAPVGKVCSIAAQGGECDGRYQETLPPATVSASSETYTISWDTDKPGIPLGLYRLSVFLDLPAAGTSGPLQPTELGFRDIELDPRSEGETPGTVLLQPGRVLPVKFRIERGIATGGSADVEALVTNDGGIYKCTSGQCGFYFPSGWLGNNPGLAGVVFVVQRFATVDGNCVNDASVVGLNPSFQQYEGCFRAYTIPDMGTTAKDIIFGMCTELAEGTYPIEGLSPFKYDAGTGVVRELKNESPVVIDPATGQPTSLVDVETCPSYAALERQGPRGMLWGGARALASRVGSFFAPREAWAVDLGLGGSIGFEDADSFSDFFWGVPHRVDIASGDGQTGDVGAVLANPIAVKVTGTHTHEHGTITELIALDEPGEQALAGIPVTFTVTAGGGALGNSALASVTVVTGADGIASTTWIMGFDPMVNTVTATIPADPGRFNRRKSVTFTATAVNTSNARSQIRVLSPAIKDQDSDVVNLKLGETRPFNAKLYQSGSSSTTGCSWQMPTTPVLVVVPGTDPGAVQITGVALASKYRVTITCGTAKRTLQFYVTA